MIAESRRPPPVAVVHVLAPQAAGGLETVVGMLATAQLARGRAVTVVALLDPWVTTLPFIAAMRTGGVPLVEVRAPPRWYWREARAVGAAADATKSVVLHSHGYRADVIGYWAARSTPWYNVSTVHGFTGRDLKNRFYEWLDLRVLRRFDAAIAVAAPIERRLVESGVLASRVHLVPSGFAPQPTLSRDEARIALGIDRDVRCIGWVGRLSPEKGADLFLDALREPVCAEVQAVILGDGPERAALEATVRGSGLGSRVRLLGRVQEAAQLMPALDVLVMSSRTEGTPATLLEAMAAGVPAVAFAVGGIPNVLDELSGWLVEPQDVGGLAHAIATVLSQPQEAARRAETARKVVQDRFGLEPWLDRIDRIYEKILAERSA